MGIFCDSCQAEIDEKEAYKAKSNGSVIVYCDVCWESMLVVNDSMILGIEDFESYEEPERE